MRRLTSRSFRWLASATVVGVVAAGVTAPVAHAAAPATATVTPTPAANSAPALARTTFAVSAPTTIRTRDRYTVTAVLPRGYASGVAVLDLRTGQRWRPIATATVRPRGGLTIHSQLSEPGRHQLRVRILRNGTVTTSRTFITTSTGTPTAGTRPLRLIAHWAADAQPQPQPRGSRTSGIPRADDPAANEPALEAASETAAQADGVESFASRLGDGVIDSVIGFGIGTLISLIFPGTATATAQQVEQLEEEVQAGFSTVLFQIEELQDTLDQVSAQNAQTFAQASLAACNSALGGVEDDTTTIQDAFANYQDVLTASWGEANLSYSSGQANATVIGNYVFGVGSNATPSFGSGVNKVQVAVNNLESAFTEDGPFNIITTCADALAAYVIQSEIPSTYTTPTNPVPVGLLDTEYAVQMQALAGQYAAIMNAGIALAGIGNLLAAATLVPAGTQTVPQFLAACQTLTTFSCPSIVAAIQQGQGAVSEVWHAVGASWSQVTNGTLAADVYAYAGSNVFTNGGNAWLTDISAYRRGLFGAGNTPGSPLSTSTADANNPASGISSLAEERWGPLTFVAADAASWNGILRTSAFTAAQNGGTSGTGSIQNQCGVALNNDIVTCKAPDQIGAYMAAAGLSNGGSPVSASNGLILYTGESYNWDPFYSPISSAFQLQADGSWNWNTGTGTTLLPNLEVATFLDTNMYPNLGVSAAVNDPDTYSFATDQGTIGNLSVSDLFPFAPYTPNRNSSDTTPMVLSTSMNNSGSNNTAVALPCATNSPYDYSNSGGSWTLLNWIGGSSTTYGSGCGWASFYPRGGAPDSAQSSQQVTTSNPPGFYVSPSINLILLANSGTGDGGIAPCTGICTSTYSNGWDAVPGFTLQAGTADVDTVSSYLWPVVPTSPANLASVCPAVAGATSNVTAFSQGDTAIGIPQMCLSLFDEWLAVAAGQDIGPVSVQINEGTGQPGGAYAAQVTFINSSNSPVTVQAGFAAAAGATISAAPTSSAISACQSRTVSSSAVPTQPAYTCDLTLPPGSTTAAVPVVFAAGQSSGALFVGTSGTQNQSVGGAAATITTAPAVTPKPPFGVTGLSAAFNTANPFTAAGGGPVQLTWDVPYSMVPITAYSIVANGPAGSTPVSMTIPASGVTIQSNGQASTSVTISTSGTWTFQVAAISANGTGAADSLTTVIGFAPPSTPRNLRGRELPGGQVALAWQPVIAAPPTTSYTVTWWSGTSQTPPSPAPAPTPGADWVTSGAGANLIGAAAVTGTSFFVPTLPTTGPWTFAVTATSPIGTSQPAVLMVNMQGGVPSRPLTVQSSLNTLGALSTQWTASPFGIPLPITYTVGLYGPATCTTPTQCTTPALASVLVTAPASRGALSVVDLFDLGSDSVPGTYTVVVLATNAFGTGGSARDSIVVTQSFIDRLPTPQDPPDPNPVGIPPSLEGLNLWECNYGFLTGPICTS